MQDKKERFKLIPEIYLLLIRENRILLSKRANTGYEDGKYSLLAGHAEENEPLTQAMIREAKEECGIGLEPDDLDLKLVMHRKTDREQVGFFFQPKKWRGEPANTGKKCRDLRWFPLSDLPPETISYIRKTIECHQQGIGYCGFGWPASTD